MLSVGRRSALLGTVVASNGLERWGGMKYRVLIEQDEDGVFVARSLFAAQDTVAAVELFTDDAHIGHYP